MTARSRSCGASSKPALRGSTPPSWKPGAGPDPAELVEIRRTLDDLAKLSKQRIPRGLEGRVDELAEKFALVSQRVDSVSSTVSTTASGLAGRNGDVNALRRAFDVESDRIGAELAEVRRGIDPAALTDMRHALKELADETSRQQNSSRQLIGQAGAKVDALAGKLDSLSTSLGPPRAGSQRPRRASPRSGRTSRMPAGA